MDRYEEAKKAYINYKQEWDNLEDKKSIAALMLKGSISALEVLFPELKESEDEKIRNFIMNEIACLRASEEKGFVRYDELTSALTWLEKQGEQKELPHFFYDDVLALRCCMDALERIQEDKGLYKQLQSLHDRVYDAYHIEKQGEQKPADKVEQTFDTTIPFGAKDSELQEASYHIPDGFHAEINGNKVVIKRGEQKPAEWSEEDESFRRLTTFYLERYVKMKDANKCIKWLITLKGRVQPQPKVEWSEEDEAYRNLLIVIMERNHPNGIFAINRKEASIFKSDNMPVARIINWLKSLRPQKQWKPSEEQMGALEKECLAHSNYQLCRLLEQLKQL